MGITQIGKSRQESLQSILVVLFKKELKLCSSVYWIILHQ